VTWAKACSNVRLASKLTGWHLDVKSESRYSKALQDGYATLVALPGVGASLADALYEKGFYSAEELLKADTEDLVQIRGIGEETALKLIQAAKQATIEAAKAAQEARAANEALPEAENPAQAPAESAGSTAEDVAIEDKATDVQETVPEDKPE